MYLTKEQHESSQGGERGVHWAIEGQFLRVRRRRSDALGAMNPPPFNMKTSLPYRVQRLFFAALAALSLACSTQLHAISLTQAQLIGYVRPANPADPADETARLQFFIMLLNTGSAVQPDQNTYVAQPGAGVPAVLPSPAVFGTKISPSGPSLALPVTISTPYTYLMAKFGPDAVYYYLGGQTGSLTDLYIPPALGTTGNGLSHISLFNAIGGPSVPDSGATLGLLGGTLLVLALVRRRFAQ